jgi:succinate dehydrogenase / fumarate reductase flavoprotein subunit
MKIFPAVHYSMGGAFVDYPAADDPDRFSRFRHMTNIAGCFHVGESEFLYHGANRLGANSLLSCIFAGLVAAMEVPRYLSDLAVTYGQLPARVFSSALAMEESAKQDLLMREGPENVHRLHEELSQIMVQHATVKRNNSDLRQAIESIQKIRERFSYISLDDRGSTMNQTLQFAGQFSAMLEIALVIAKGALLRDEFRGAHYKQGFDLRDDKNWLKTTIATYDPQEPVITYKPVDIRHFSPTVRDYTVVKKQIPVAENVPKNMQLPV